MQRKLLALAMVVFLAALVLRSQDPIQVFASEQERSDFMKSIGAQEQIRLIALVTDWCPACRAFEASLESAHIPYARVNIEENSAGRALFEKGVALGAPRAIPQAVFGLSIVGQAEAFKQAVAEQRGQATEERPTHARQ